MLLLRVIQPCFDKYICAALKNKNKKLDTAAELS